MKLDDGDVHVERRCVLALNRSPNRLSGRSNSRGARLAGRRTHHHARNTCTSRVSSCLSTSIARSYCLFSLPLPPQQNSLYPLYNVERIMRTGNYGDRARPLPPRMRSMLPFRYGDDDDSSRVVDIRDLLTQLEGVGDDVSASAVSGRKPRLGITTLWLSIGRKNLRIYTSTSILYTEKILQKLL